MFDGQSEVNNGVDIEPKINKLKFFSRSVLGTNHSRNEDAVGVSLMDGIVCDGVGGLNDGDKASERAKELLLKGLREVKDLQSAVNIVSKVFKETSTIIKKEIPNSGTTATIAKFIESKDRLSVVIGHIGDSRAYLFREGRLIQLTDDDNTINQPKAEKKRITERLDSIMTEEDLKKLLPQERVYFQQRHQITHYLGEKIPSAPQVYVVDDLKTGDKIVLVSDGISDNLTKTEIEQTLMNNPINPAASLVERAQARSIDSASIRAKIDDSSAIIIEYSPRIISSDNINVIKKQFLVLEAIAKSEQRPDAVLQAYTAAVNLLKNDLSYSQLAHGRDLVYEIWRKYYKELSTTERPLILGVWRELHRAGTIANHLKEFCERFNKGIRAEEDFIRGIDCPFFSPDKAKELASIYNNEKIQLRLQEMFKGSISVRPPWFSFLNGDYYKNENVGRIYLNPNPLLAGLLFRNIAELLQSGGIPSELKTIARGEMDAKGLERADKMVLYFDAADQRKVLNIIHTVYSEYGANSFQDKIPKFAIQLGDEKGVGMRGIAFGQEPAKEFKEKFGGQHRQFSFTTVRAWALSNMVESGAIKSTDYETKFRDCLKDFFIDPINPAFNLPFNKGRDLFGLIYKNSI